MMQQAAVQTCTQFSCRPELLLQYRQGISVPGEVPDPRMHLLSTTSDTSAPESESESRAAVTTSAIVIKRTTKDACHVQRISSIYTCRQHACRLTSP